jgi:dTMP kinase
VLSDRFALTTEAYQMAGRGIPPEVVLPANRAAAGGLRPDLTLIIDLPPEIGRARQEAAGKRLDRIERESPDFHQRVNEFYLAVRGDGVRHLDGRLGPDQLLQAAWKEVVSAAPGRFGPATD